VVALESNLRLWLDCKHSTSIWLPGGVSSVARGPWSSAAGSVVDFSGGDKSQLERGCGGVGIRLIKFNSAVCGLSSPLPTLFHLRGG